MKNYNISNSLLASTFGINLICSLLFSYPWKNVYNTIIQSFLFSLTKLIQRHFESFTAFQNKYEKHVRLKITLSNSLKIPMILKLFSAI